MTAVVPSRAERIEHLIAAVIALTIAALIHGLTTPLLSLVLEAQGVSSTLIGLSAAAQFVSVIAVAPFAPRLLSKSAPPVLMLWAIVSMTVVLLILPLWPNVYLWFPLRFLLGVGAGFLWIAGEAWVNHTAEDVTRGRVLAVYGMAAAGGFAFGPLLLAATGRHGFAPFLLAAGVLAIACLPLLRVLSSRVRLEGVPSAPLARYVLMAPVAMGVYAIFSATDAMLLSFLPIYAIELGLPEPDAIRLLTVLALGAIALQYPFGWLADHYDAMVVAGAAVVAMLLGSLALPWAVPHFPANLVFMFFYGGVFGALYIVPLILIGRRFKGADLGAATTVYSIMFCAGAVGGPPLAGAGMEMLGNEGLRWTLVALYALGMLLPVVGLRKRWQA